MLSEFFETNILTLKNKLFRFAYCLLMNRQEAEDIVQEVMIKCWLQGEKLKQIRNVEAWCMTVTRNLSYDRLRSVSKIKVMAVEDIKEQDIPSKDINPLDRSELGLMLAEMIRKLSDKQQQVILLRDVEGYSYKQIGSIMGIDENLVKVTLFRARDNMRKMILKTNQHGI